MDELKKIKALLLQNQKIIRYASSSVSLDSFDEEIIRIYNENAKTIQDFRLDINGFHSNYADYKEKTEQSYIDITANGIDLCVKTKDVVSELNSELRIDGNVIDCTSKWFLVDTENFKLTKTSLTFNGEVNGQTCDIGGWKIAGDSMSGSSLSSGTVNCKNLTLGNAVAKEIDCNPDGISGKAVKLTGLKKDDNAEKDESTTTITGINSNGPIYATNGWNDDEHGCPYSVQYDLLTCDYVYLRSSGGSYSTKNRLTCTEIESTKADEIWSDRRLKKDIETLDLDKAEALMLGIVPVEFDITETKKHAAGYIAQDVLRELEKNGLRGIVTENNGFLGIRYDELIAFRIAQIQRNQKRIDMLREYNKITGGSNEYTR